MTATSISPKSSPDRLSLSELEAYIRTIDTSEYTKTRNYIGGSTQLSEYISRGMISLPRIRELVLEKNSFSASFKFLNELAWREYWQLTWTAIGDDIFDYIRPIKDTVRPAMPEAVINAHTGIVALDAGIRQLQTTGFIDNHMRMWLAGLVCQVAKCDWKVGAAWMHSYLIDGDYASNHLSWQWVAGSYTGKPYLPQQDNINTYTESLQKDTYLDQGYGEIASMEIPEILLETVDVLPAHEATLPEDTVTLDGLNELKNADTILLYSPWTLDPLWRKEWQKEDKAIRVLLIDPDEFGNGRFSQQVIDSIVWFAGQVPDLKIICEPVKNLEGLTAVIIRKSYPGITTWPGIVDEPEMLFPEVPVAFYPSFSSYWKQIKKYSMTDQQSLF